MGASVIEYFSPSGEYLLMTGRDGPAIIEDGGPELVGKFSRAVTSSSGRPGGFPRPVVVDPFEVVLACYIRPSATRTFEQEYARFRRLFEVDRDGQLQVTSRTWGALSTPVRLGAHLPAPGVLPGARDHEQVDLPLWGKDGVFWSGWKGREFSGGYTESVTVTNPGDVWVWPEFVWWSDQPTWVTMPSGARVDLPMMGSRDKLTLRMSKHGVSVVDADGSPRRDVLSQVSQMWPEGVPPRSSREYKVLTGSVLGPAVVRWRSGHLDPWR